MGSFERDVGTGKGVWSEQTCRIFGYEPFSIEPTHDLFRSHVHADDPVQIRKDFFQKYKTHGKQKGTGLGTYSAKLIADTMGYGLSLDISDQEDSTTITMSASESSNAGQDRAQAKEKP